MATRTEIIGDCTRPNARVWIGAICPEFILVPFRT